MKVTAEHLALLKAAIEPADTEERRERYRKGEFPRADRVQDLDKRYRWDLAWETKALQPLFDEGDYKDAHLDTALRTIVPAL